MLETSSGNGRIGSPIALSPSLGGKAAGIEVKAAATVGKLDFTGLAALAEAAGKKFIRGVVLYLGDSALPFGNNMWVVPIGELWLGS